MADAMRDWHTDHILAVGRSLHDLQHVDGQGWQWRHTKRKMLNEQWCPMNRHAES